MTISSEDLWRMTIQDKEFMSSLQGEKAANVMKDYIDKNLLIVLAPLLDKPATIANLIDTKIAYMKDALSAGLISKIMAASPQDSSLFFDAKDLIEIAEAMLSSAIDMLEPIAKDIQTFLNENETDEFSLYMQMGLNPDNIGKAMNGELNIGALLLSQPTIILKMDN